MRDNIVLMLILYGQSERGRPSSMLRIAPIELRMYRVRPGFGSLTSKLSTIPADEVPNLVVDSELPGKPSECKRRRDTEFVDVVNEVGLCRGRTPASEREGNVTAVR